MVFFFKDFREARRWWFRDVEIDIVSKNSANNEILIGECKWKTGIDAKTLLKELAEKTKWVGWQQKERKEIFALFARSFKEKVTEWEGHEVICFDLQDIEAALTL